MSPRTIISEKVLTGLRGSPCPALPVRCTSGAPLHQHVLPCGGRSQDWACPAAASTHLGSV